MARWLYLISALMMLMSCSETESNVLEGPSGSAIPTPVLVYNYRIFVDGVEYYCNNWAVARERPKELKLYGCQGYNGKDLSITGCGELTIIPIESLELEATSSPP